MQQNVIMKEKKKTQRNVEVYFLLLLFDWIESYFKIY